VTLDLSKPVCLLGSRVPVRILCTDAPGDCPVVGIVEVDNVVMRWSAAGNHYPNTDLLSQFDLINVPEEPREIVRWVIFYDNDDDFLAFSSEFLARDHAREYPDGISAIKQVPLRFTPGEGL
jgi:hypothetical protein